MLRFALPLAVLVILVGFLAVGLNRDPREVPSPLIGKPAPEFTLPKLQTPDQSFSSQQLAGKVWVLNVWASWCVPCRQEHPLLLELARQSGVPIYGLNYKDQPSAAMRLLGELGDPYQLTLRDGDGAVGIDYGVYAVPETFIVDKQGVIRFKQIGPITADALKEKILPLVRQLNG